MRNVRLLFAVLVLGVAPLAACDLVVSSDETTELANDGTVWGFSTPNAVVVRPRGTLIVKDAKLFGRGAQVEQLDVVPDLFGAAVVSDGGTVRVQKGMLSGGSVRIVPDDPSTPPSPPPGGIIGEIRVLPSALVATNSTVEIEGGTLVSGGELSELAGTQRFFPSPAVSVTGGSLAIRGGELRTGASAFTVAPVPPLSSGLTVLRADAASIDISGGTFRGSVSWDPLESTCRHASLSIL